MTIQLFRCGLLMAGLSLFTHSVIADDSLCGDPSPLILSGKEYYDAHSPNPISPREFKVLQKLIQGLKGKYKGRWQDTICLDIEKSKIQVLKASATAEIERSSKAEMNIQLELENEDFKAIEALVYDLNPDILMAVETSDGSVPYVVESLSRNELILNIKSVKWNGKAYIPEEQTVRLNRKGRRLNLKIETFFRGELVGFKEVALTRF